MMIVSMRLLLGAFIVSTIAVLSACTSIPDRPYHVSACAGPTCTAPAVDQGSASPGPFGFPVKPCASGRYYPRPYKQAWLEVDEEGHLWNEAQIQSIKHEIDAAHSAGRSVFLLTFVHGWQGNADDGERLSNPCVDSVGGQVDNLYGFVGRVADSLQRGTDDGTIRGPPIVLSVFVGWRGADLKGPPVLQPISFASRARAADRIGRARGPRSLRAAFDDIYSSLGGSDRALTSGLSFGGRILTMMYLQDEDGSSIRSIPGNVVFATFNAAMGADCLNTALGQNIPSDKPNWFNVSSADDLARARWYKLGSTLLLGRNHCIDRSSNRNLAAGFDPAQITHKLQFGPLRVVKLPAPAPFGPPNWVREPREARTIAYSFRDKPTGGMTSYSGDTQFEGMKLEPLRPAGKVWLLTADSTVFSDDRKKFTLNNLHSTVFTRDLTRLFVAYLYSSPN